MDADTQEHAANNSPNSTQEKIIEVREVSKRFGDEIAVRQASFYVPRGTIFGLIGPSGAGKTTLIRMLTGVYKADEGEMTVLDRDPLQFSGAERMAIGYMPQLFVLYPRLTVRENLHFVASMYGLGASRFKRIRETLEFVELEGDLGKQARKLSGGMQRRLSLSTALIHDPELIFLDEPTAGIDPVLRQKIWDGFFELREQGKTLFVTTQYVSEAANCDLVAVLSDGAVKIVDTPAGLRRAAYGGEVLRVDISRPLSPDDYEDLQGLSFVKSDVVVHSGTMLRIVVDDAKSSIPKIMDWLGERGIEVDSVEIDHPPFDDVFVELVENPEDLQHA